MTLSLRAVSAGDSATRPLSASSASSEAWLGGSARFALWYLLVALTAAILAYPVSLKPETSVVWSPGLFPNLPLFGALFYLWAAALLVLLFASGDRSTGSWAHFSVTVIGALVFRGFWSIPVPIQGQANAHLIATKIWQEAGHVIRHPAASYIEWPGVSLASSAISQITGLDLFWSISALTLFVSAALGAATYVFLLNVLRSTRLAALASLLIIAGDLALIIYHTAGPTATVFVVLLLAVLFQGKARESQPWAVVALVLLAGATVIHLHSAMNYFFFLLGLQVLVLFKNRKTADIPTMSQLLIAFSLPIAWITFWAISALHWIATGAGDLATDPLDLWPKLWGVFTIGEANFGESAPAWYSYTRQAWLVLIHALGGAVWLWNLKRLPRLEPTEARLSAVFGGLVLISGTSGLVSQRGFGELLRALTYVPYFTLSLQMLSVRSLPRPLFRAAIGGLALALVVLSLPTFFANNSRISLVAPYRSEYAGGAWLRSLYGPGESLKVYLTHPIFGAFLYHLTEATINSDTEAESGGYTKEARWQAMEKLLSNFERATQEGPALYVHSAKMAIISSYSFGIPTDDPQWEVIGQRLAGGNQLVYDNGTLEIFAGVPHKTTG